MLNTNLQRISDIVNPLASSYWQHATSQLIAIGAAEAMDIRHCTALSVKVVDFLSFLSSRNVEMRELTPIKWYRPFDFATSSSICNVDEWRLQHPKLSLAQPGSIVLVPVDTVYRLRYRDHDLILATPTQQVFWGSGIEDINPLLLAGESQDMLLDLTRDYYQTRCHQTSRITFWGAGILGQEPSPTKEDALILDPVLKRDLLQYVDRFWRHQQFARDHRLPVRRGLLLAGHPGTGKTQFIRHIITRFPEAAIHVMTPANDQSSTTIFPAMLSRVRALKEASIVVIEDIDRLFDQRGVTAQFFLNALDGLLSVDATILWIATTNDPGALKLNVLDRPGRFDRVAVFPEPGPEERAAMIGLYCDRTLGDHVLAAAVDAAKGLTGAHIREACVAARLAELDYDTSFEELLGTELNRIRKQHESTRRYDIELSATRITAGFGEADRAEWVPPDRLRDFGVS